MTIVGKVRRLLTMDRQEIQWRISQELLTCGERAAYDMGPARWSARRWRQRLCRFVEERPASTELAAWWHRHMRTRSEPPFLLEARSVKESAEAYPQVFPEGLAAVVADAEQVCRGEFSFLGIKFRAGDEIDWQRDPHTGRSWPPRFYADLTIPFCEDMDCGDVGGDSKHVWELNRHEFLIRCGMAYYLTRDPRFAHRVFQIITHWIDKNPFLQGINWAGPLEVALRSMSWIWAYQFCRNWEELSPDDHLELIKSLYQHGVYLARHMEVYSSPNNHLVGEATALYLLGSFFPEFDESATWKDRAWAILESQSARQFYDDGGSTEQAISYHYYCLGFFVLATLTRARQELPIPQTMLKRLEAAFAFGMWMTTPDGTAPAIGDTDDARSIRFGRVVPWDFRNLLSIGAAMFERGDMKAVAGGFSEDAFWLLGVPGLQRFQKLPSTYPAETAQVFPSSGYAILRSGWDKSAHHLCFDCGSIGVELRADDIPIFTHGHADMLSLTVSAFGKPLLVDGGFFTYNGSQAWHRYTREAQAHNTLRVDGQSPAQYCSKNAWSGASPPGPIVRKTANQSERLEGHHSAFSRVVGVALHQRTIEWDRGSAWRIADRLEGTGTHLVEAFFHFAPGSMRRLLNGQGVAIVTEDGVHAMLHARSDQLLQLDCQCGGAEPDGGWIATGYGRKTPAPVARFHGELQLPCEITFELTVTEGGGAASMIEKRSVDEEQSKYHLVDSDPMHPPKDAVILAQGAAHR